MDNINLRVAGNVLIRNNIFRINRLSAGSDSGIRTGGSVFAPIFHRLAIAVMTGSCLFAPGLASAFSLETALGYLLIEHPNISAAEKTLESTRLGIDQASARLLPTVSLATDAGPQHIDDTTLDGYVRTKQTATLTVTQSLFDGQSTLSSIQAARLNTEASDIALEQTRQTTMFEGVTAYIDVLRQKRLVDLGLENVENIQQQLNLADERVRRGSGIAVDILEAKSRLQIAKERLVSFQGALRDASSRYKQVFGREPDLENMFDPWPPIELIPSSLDDAIASALRENPAVNNSAASVEIAREGRHTAEAELFPVVNLEGVANYEKNNSTTIGIKRDYTVLVRATWDLFSGFSTPASMDRATYDYRASRDNHSFVQRKVTEQVHLAWQSPITTQARVRLLENAVNIAAEVFDSRVKLHEAGKGDVVSVLDAENQMTSAQINYTSTSYDERLASYQVILVTGRLTPENLNLPQP